MLLRQYCKGFYLFIILLLSYHQSYGNKIEQEIQERWKKYAVAKDAHIKKELLLEIVDDSYLLEKQTAVDSIYEILFDEARLSNKPKEEIELYNNYFNNNDHKYPDKAIEYANRMMSLAHMANNMEWFYDAYSAYAKVYLSTRNIEMAAKNVNKALEYANLLSNEELKAKNFLLLGYCAELSNEKIEAIRHYINALYIAEKKEDSSLIFTSYKYFANFYLVTGNYEKAIYYKMKLFPFFKLHNDRDSLRLMKVYNEYTFLLYEDKEKKLGDKLSALVINFAQEHQYYFLKNDALHTIRQYLINNNLINELSDLYTKEYPNELDIISKEDTTLYYRIMAYIQEAHNHPDSSLVYYTKAESRILCSNQYPTLANFFKRYGQFLIRTGNLEMAKEKMTLSYQYALKAHYYPFIIDATHYLDSINYVQHHYNEAYEYATLNREYADSLSQSVKGDELLMLEIENENKQHELLETKEKEETERKHSLEDIAIVIVIMSLFIVLVMLGSFKVSNTVIRALGFISFILLFEFIVMVTEKKIEPFTDEQPWKMLAFKLVLMSMLLPLHHWLEHKVIHYLSQHKLNAQHLKPFINKTMTNIRKKKEETH